MRAPGTQGRRPLTSTALLSLVTTASIAVVLALSASSGQGSPPPTYPAVAPGDLGSAEAANAPLAVPEPGRHANLAARKLTPPQTPLWGAPPAHPLWPVAERPGEQPADQLWSRTSCAPHRLPTGRAPPA